MATVTKGRTFVSGEVVTPTKLNTLVDSATVTQIVDADISATAALADTKLATIATAGKVSNSATTATSANTASAIVARDASGNFSAGTITANLTGNVTGTASAIADGAVTPAKLSQPYTLATAKNSTSGTSIDFTGIPSWVKRITVMFNGVSTSGSSSLQIQVGAGSFPATPTGYYGYATVFETTSLGTGAVSTGLLLETSTIPAYSRFGQCIMSLIGTNIWSYTTHFGIFGSTGPRFNSGAGTTGSALSGTLDRIRITTVNGTDTFDAGSINISYEG